MADAISLTHNKYLFLYVCRYYLPSVNILLCDYFSISLFVICVYPKGQPGEGFVIAMKQLEKARIGISSQALGIGQAALELAVKYSGERKAFGKPISNLQAVKVSLQLPLNC